MDRAGSTSCPVCGYDAGYPPWGEDGRLPTFDICACCGTEWGYEGTPEGTGAPRER